MTRLTMRWLFVVLLAAAAAFAARDAEGKACGPPVWRVELVSVHATGAGADALTRETERWPEDATVSDPAFVLADILFERAEQ